MTIKTHITPGVAAKMNSDDNYNEFVLGCVLRHLSHDWGDVSRADAELNNDDFFHALSAYHDSSNEKIWIKQDGIHITVLLPEEY